MSAGFGPCVAEAVTPRTRRPGMPVALTAGMRLLPLILAASLPATSFACSIALPPDLAPELWSAPELPANAILLRRGDLTQVLHDGNVLGPDDAVVEWDAGPSPWSADVELLLPVGGWMQGEYTFVDGGVAFRIGAEHDTEPPADEVTWQGFSAQPGGFCSLQSPDRVWLSFGDSPQAIARFVYVDREADGEPDAVLFGWEGTVALDPTAEHDLVILSVDAAGNESETRVEGARGCTGCQGSVGGGGSALGLLLGLGLVRRRRELR